MVAACAGIGERVCRSTRMSAMVEYVRKSVFRKKGRACCIRYTYIVGDILS